MEFTHVNGRGSNKIVLYAISTCVWCKKIKTLLDSLGLAYDYIDVDLLEKDESDQADKDVRIWNQKGTYPTIIVNDQRSINGYQEDEIKKLAP